MLCKLRVMLLNRNFLWGTSTDKKKLHLVRWQKVIKSKKQCGLGIREARSANIALLAKIRGHLVHGVDKLWARVLRQKYIKSNAILEVQPKSRDSSTGHGILKSLNHLHKRFEWWVEKGNLVLSWFDAWLSDLLLCMCCARQTF